MPDQREPVRRAVLFNGSDYVMGDTTVSIVVAEALVANHMALTVASVPGPALEELRRRVPSADVVELPPPLWTAARWRRPIVVALTGLRALRLLVRVRPALVHVPDRTVVSPLAMLAAVFARCPFVLHVHHFGTFRSKRRYRVLGRLARQVWCPSEFMRAKASDIGLGRAVVVANCVPPAHGPPVTRAEARAELGIPDAQVAAVVLARLSPFKGQATAIRAMGDARVRASGVHLYVVGSDTGEGRWDDPPRPDYERYLRELAASSGVADVVTFLGQRPGTVALAAADVAVLVSDDEPFGLTVLEAAQAGVPIIAGRSGATPEIVVDGHSAVLVPPRDPDALAAALSRLCTDRAEARRLAAAASAVPAAFSVERFHARVGELADQVAYHRRDERSAASTSAARGTTATGSAGSRVVHTSATSAAAPVAGRVDP